MMSFLLHLNIFSPKIEIYLKYTTFQLFFVNVYWYILKCCVFAGLIPFKMDTLLCTGAPSPPLYLLHTDLTMQEP